MADYCTIFAGKDARAAGLAAVRELVSGAPDVEGEDGAWDRLTLSLGETTLTFNVRVKHEVGDPTSRMLLGARNYFRGIWPAEGAEQTKKDIIQLLIDCTLAVGVVAEPGFSEEEKHFDVIFALARALDGMIFNGSGMLDANGYMLLDHDGSFDADRPEA